MGAWIETLFTAGTTVATRSHPLWVRGLKRKYSSYLQSHLKSHPLWVRGLKLLSTAMYGSGHRVASFMGAWIETFLFSYIDILSLSHPLWVRGLKREQPGHAAQP